MPLLSLKDKQMALVEVRTQVIKAVNRVFTDKLLIIGGFMSYILAYHTWEWFFNHGIKHVFYYLIALGMALHAGYFRRAYKEGILGVFTEIVFYLFLFNIVDEARQECMDFYWNQYLIGILIVVLTIYKNVNKLKVTHNGK